ncbi:hypothetical protein AB1N83_011741, partial [Pleurotus pulmonarius]
MHHFVRSQSFYSYVPTLGHRRESELRRNNRMNMFICRRHDTPMTNFPDKSPQLTHHTSPCSN